MIEIKKGLKICTLDIESTGLKADYAKIMCVVIKEYIHRGSKKGKVWTIRIDDKKNPDKHSDKWIVQETYKVLSEFDVLVTWNGTYFDRKFLKTRAFLHGMKPALPMIHRDLCIFARTFLFGSRKLKFQAAVILGKTDKTFTTPKVWFALMRHEKWALDFMVAHCRYDVSDTEKLYRKYLPFLNQKVEAR